MEKDWRLEILEDCEYLYGVRFQHMKYRQYRDDWDHDHCVGCGVKFAEDDYPSETILHDGYTTCSDYDNSAEYWWVCPDCFGLLKNAMGWVEVENPN